MEMFNLIIMNRTDEPRGFIINRDDYIVEILCFHITMNMHWGYKNDMSMTL